MRILGIDPGLATIGYGIIDKRGSKHIVVSYGAIITKPKFSVEERLCQIKQDLDTILTEYKPDSLAIEELFFNSNVKTAITVAQARGVLLMGCHSFGLDCHGYTPLQVKSAVCGYGHAKKNQVQYMVTKLLNLESVPKPDDVADALAVAICHSHSCKLKVA